MKKKRKNSKKGDLFLAFYLFLTKMEQEKTKIDEEKRLNGVLERTKAPTLIVL